MINVSFCLRCVCIVASTDTETEFAANCLWLVTNSKPCPKCMAPIQKNDGCNHMKCTKVRLGRTKMFFNFQGGRINSLSFFSAWRRYPILCSGPVKRFYFVSGLVEGLPVFPLFLFSIFPFLLHPTIVTTSFSP